MHGSGVRPDAESVRTEWEGWALRCAARGGFANRVGEHQIVDGGAQAAAYVSDGRWVTNCPACNGGIGVWVGMSDGCCYDCGRVWQIVFPSASEIGRAETVLSKRPDSGTQNWRPDLGETIADLKAENAVRGFDFTEEV